MEFHLWNKFNYGELLFGSSFQKLTSKEKEIALNNNCEIICRISAEIGFSALTLPGEYWEISPGQPAYYWLPPEYLFEQAKLLKNNLNDNIAIIANVGGVLSIPAPDIYYDFSIKMFESPEEIDFMAAERFRESVERIDAFSQIGINCFMTASDLADNNGPFFPPGEFRRFILPYLHRFAEYADKQDAYSILHSDGNLSKYMEDITGSGISALQSIDPVAGMNMEDLISRFGNKITFCGNFDCGDLFIERPEIIYKTVSEKLKTYYKAGNFVFGASNAVQPEIDLENYLSLVSAWKDFNNSLT